MLRGGYSNPGIEEATVQIKEILRWTMGDLGIMNLKAACSRSPLVVLEVWSLDYHHYQQEAH